MKTMLPKTLLFTTLMLISTQSVWAKLDTSNFQKHISASAKNFPAQLGVGIMDAKTGESWYLNGDEHFRLQSVAKLLVAIAALQQVDTGKLQLEEKIPLTKSDISAIRNATMPEPISPTAKTATLNSLIEYSICRSNNGAVDVITRALGGPAVVDKTFKDAQISDIRVDRYEAEISAHDDNNKGKALLDSGTPRALSTLLYKLESGKLLSQKSTDYLLGLMSRCETGVHRIPAGFPKGWTVAHKTGTGRTTKGITVNTNDVAIITAPDKSRWILVVFVADAKLNRSACENKIAEIAKTLHASIH
jgi:beta-lactamase class A